MSYQLSNHKIPVAGQASSPTPRIQMLVVSSHTGPAALQTWLLQYTGFHIPEQSGS